MLNAELGAAVQEIVTIAPFEALPRA